MNFLRLIASNTFNSMWLLALSLVAPQTMASDQPGGGFSGLDMSIEGMKSQQFSVAIFYFLVMAIFIFLGFILMFMLKSKASKLKTGEKWLFAWLLLGVIVAVVFGAAQMLHGYLF